MVTAVFRRLRSLTPTSKRSTTPSIYVEQVQLEEYTVQKNAPLKKAYDPDDFGGIYLGPTAEKVLAAEKAKSSSQLNILDAANPENGERAEEAKEEPSQTLGVDVATSDLVDVEPSPCPPQTESEDVTLPIRPSTASTTEPFRATFELESVGGSDKTLSKQSSCENFTQKGGGLESPTLSQASSHYDNVTEWSSMPSHASTDSPSPTNSAIASEAMSLASETPSLNTRMQRKLEDRERFNRAVKPPKLDIVIRAPPEALCGIRWADSESVMSFNSQDTVRILPEYIDENSSLKSASLRGDPSEPSSPVWIRRTSGNQLVSEFC